MCIVIFKVINKVIYNENGKRKKPKKPISGGFFHVWGILGWIYWCHLCIDAVSIVWYVKLLCMARFADMFPAKEAEGAKGSTKIGAAPPPDLDQLKKRAER